MVTLRRTKGKRPTRDLEDDFASFDHSKSTEFHPHCFIGPLALAEAKRFDGAYALAHAPVLVDEE
jgi:hypothetical protein